MTILQALNRYYDRMAARGEADPPGYSREKISFAIVLSAGGQPVDRLDLREAVGKELRPRLVTVPVPLGTRTVAIAPNFLWDKTAYVLGRAKPRKKRKDGKPERTPQEHAAFKAANLDLIGDSDDQGLVAVRRFLQTWVPSEFDRPPFVPEMLDTNIVFRVEGDESFLHERAAARRLNAARTSTEAPRAVCLVTGETAPIQRLHPPIRGVDGAQSSGAALVSFNLEAFTAYGNEQGANAPTSQAAAFRYSTALNRMLDRGSRNRLPRRIGDATVVFWADASGVGEEAASAAEDWFARLFNPQAESDPDRLEGDKGAAAKLRELLHDVAAGRPMRDIDPRLSPGVRFYVLGLAPNVARLSVRYWLEDSFEAFARRLADHYIDLAIEPPPWRSALPAISRLLVRSTALQEKFDHIPPMLAGEMTRAVLTGAPYPRTLLSAAITRLRAGDNPETGWHAAAIRAVLARARRLHHSTEEIPVGLDRDNSNPAYQLGRLFAVLETAQRLALGRLSATIRDRYFGAASATPASVFPLLLRGVQSHLGKLRKDGKGGWIEKELEEITGRLPPELPRALRLEAQGRFAVGYYHQRKAQFAGRPVSEAAAGGDEEDENHE